MTAIYIQNGDALDHLAQADVPQGAVVVLADTAAVAPRAIPAGTLGALALTGVFVLPRLSGGVIPQGRRLAWDPAAQHVTTNLTLAGVVPLGIAAAESGDADTTVPVRLG